MCSYMEKWFVLLLSLLLTASFVVAQEMPDAGIGVEDVEKLGELQEKYSPLDESGEVDFTKYSPFVTKADMRIKAINLWLEDNASWLKVVFGMVPSITWLFAINFYFLLLFLLILVLNASATFGFFSFLQGKIDAGIVEFSWASVFGAGIFVALLALKVYVSLANLAYGLFDVFWNYILPWGIAIAIILLIVVGVFFVMLLIYAPHVLVAIKKGIDARKEKKAAEKQALNRKVLEKVVEGVVED